MLKSSNYISSDTYWASEPNDKIASAILAKKDNFYSYLLTNNYLLLYQKCWNYYYCNQYNLGELMKQGEQGELITIYVNDFKNLLSHLEALTVQQRLAFEPKPTNSDTKSMAQVDMSKNLLEYCMVDKDMESVINTTVKQGLLYGEGFVRIDWDHHQGQQYGTTTSGAPVYEGDVAYYNYNPTNVIRDASLNDPNKCQWYIFRDFENKFDLIQKYPELKQDIISCPQNVSDQVRTTTVNNMSLQDSDNIVVYTLLHDRTPSLPNGRYVQCLDNETVLFDGQLPFDKMPVCRLAPDEQDGTIFGNSISYDLLPIQKALNILYSTALTNQATYGVQNMLVPEGSNLNISSLRGGNNTIYYNPLLPAPAPFNPTSTPAEIFNFMQQLNQIGETLSGINSVVRGNPEASLKSGTALAFVQAQAIQFAQNLQRSHVKLAENLASLSINMFKQFADAPRVITICGKSKIPLMKYFSKEDVSNISRVLINIGSPLMRTIAGKSQVAETLFANGLIKSPEQYLQLINTGTFDPLVEGEQAELLLIKDENESLADNKPVRVISTDNHRLHIQEHKAVLANTNIRLDPNNPIVIATLNHIYEHIQDMNNPNTQALQAALSGQPMQPPQGPPGAPPPAGPTPVQPQPPNSPNPPPGADPNSSAIMEEQAALNDPNSMNG